MLIKRNTDVPSSEITSESVYLSRRQFMGKSLQSLAAASVLLAAGCERADGKCARRKFPGLP
jgi:hypothetical protein